MKVLFDIGHPAHVHYFKNLIWLLQNTGNEIFVTARNKEVAHNLLSAYRIKYFNRGKGGNNLFSKILYFFKGDYLIYKRTKAFQPNLLVSFASPYLAQVSQITGIPHLVIDDTEHNNWNHFLYKHFSNAILTPSCFRKEFGSKHLKFNSYMELCYLHPNYFSPQNDIYNILGLKANEKYIILRFVSWKAIHDIGEGGLSYEYKIKLVSQLSKNYKVFISSEGVLPSKLEKYRLQIKPENLHSVLAHADLYIGEGSTTASECSVLGTPNIYINSLSVCYCAEQEKRYGLTYNFNSEEGILEKAIEILSDPESKDKWLKKRIKMLNDKIDVTAFFYWFIVNYPESFTTMKENPDYQYFFK